MHSETLFEIPKLLYFKSKNCFSGSLKDFSYKIIPDGSNLSANVWEGRNCMEKSDLLVSQEFPLDAEGREKMIDWLTEQYYAYLKNPPRE